jgi:helix-turn-helix protein
MSWQATDWAMRQNAGKAGRKLLLLALASYADKDGICWPSQATLARDTEQSVDTVQRQIIALQQLALLKRDVCPSDAVSGRATSTNCPYNLAARRRGRLRLGATICGPAGPQNRQSPDRKVAA